MRLILLVVSLLFFSKGVFAEALMLPEDIKLEQQNGKLLHPMLDPKTGKYTENLERGYQIIRERSQLTYTKPN